MLTTFYNLAMSFNLPHSLDSLNVYENIGITLLENNARPDEVLAIVKEKLAMVNLSEDNLNKYPSELSGGMKKARWPCPHPRDQSQDNSL